MPAEDLPCPSDFTRHLAPALRHAAQVVRALEGRVANHPKRREASDVKAALTVADTASQEALLGPLLEHFPGVCLAAEEDTPSIARFPRESAARVVIDPIDGTLRFYLEDRGPYAVMLGLALGGVYQAALVALPREGLLFEAVRGRGARVARVQSPLRTARLAPSGRRVLVSHDLPRPAVACLEQQGLEVVPASGGAISVAPLVPGVCGGLRLVRSSQGTVSIRGRIGALIAEEAGALLRCETGAPFPREIEAPARALLVAAGEKGLRALQDALVAARAG